ncbi:MAG: hypothetical protein ACYSW8_29400 [Planctomycetota bacterium]|jgi:hypothetical protein
MKPEVFTVSKELLDTLGGDISREDGVAIFLSAVTELADALGVEVDCKVVGSTRSTVSPKIVSKLIPKLTTIIAAISVRSHVDPRDEIRKRDVQKLQRDQECRQARTSDGHAPDAETDASPVSPQAGQGDEASVDQ